LNLRVAARSSAPAADAARPVSGGGGDDESQQSPHHQSHNAANQMLTDRDGHRLARKTALACCTSMQRYSLDRLLKSLVERRFAPTMLGRDVLFVPEQAGGSVFLFADGCVVFWGTQLDTEASVLDAVESLHESLPMPELERMYFYQGRFDASGIRNHDIIVQDDGPAHAAETQQRLLAFSYGLSRSVQLAVLENQVDRVIERTRHLPDDLVSSWYVRMFQNRRREVRQRLHEVFTLRGHVNLHKDLTEAPDLYWDAPERSRAPTSRLSTSSPSTFASSASTSASITPTSSSNSSAHSVQESYSHRLEIIIIALISVEILLAIFYHGKDAAAAASAAAAGATGSSSSGGDKR
jgi:uncharacterized Rmd1/YagE family protein